MRGLPQIALYASLGLALAVGAVGCKHSQDVQNQNAADQNAADQNPGQDPANANVAPVSNASDNTAAPAGAYTQPDDQYGKPATASQAQQNYSSPTEPGSGDQSGQYPSQRTAAQNGQSAPPTGYDQYSTHPDPYAQPYSSGDNYDNYNNYAQPVAYAPQPPPPLPEYQQPQCPGEGYIWTPGSWQWDSSQGYYWVPGAWVSAPYQGALWTPGWWGFTNRRYGWHRGYWGRHVGYYGGIPYGHGYTGYGYEGGYWRGNNFAYNREVNNLNTTVVKNVYVYKVIKVTNTRASFNGPKGINLRPRPAEIAAMHEQHNPPMSTQMQLVQQAHGERQNFAKFNHDRPALVAVNHPVAADHDVKPPQPVRYQAQAQRPTGPPAQQAPVQPRFTQPAPQQPGNEAHQQNRAPMPGQRMQARPNESARPNAPARANAQQEGTQQRRQPEPQHLGPNRQMPQQEVRPNRPESPQGNANRPANQHATQGHPAQQQNAKPETRQQEHKGTAQDRNSDNKRPEDNRPQ